MSIVELMVGIAVGMFVVAAASLLVASQLTDNKRLLYETQLQQDLRSSLDIIVRDLRRAGSNQLIANAADAVWVTGGPEPAEVPFIDVTPSSGGPAQQVDFYSSRTNTDFGKGYGFRLNSSEYVVQTLLPNGAGWQDLTDKKTMKVTLFEVTPQNEPVIQLVCPKLCSTGDQACWPTFTPRSFKVKMTAQSVYDANIGRTVEAVVRLRADHLKKIGASVCPA